MTDEYQCHRTEAGLFEQPYSVRSWFHAHAVQRLKLLPAELGWYACFQAQPCRNANRLAERSAGGMAAVFVCVKLLEETF